MPRLKAHAQVEQERQQMRVPRIWSLEARRASATASISTTEKRDSFPVTTKLEPCTNFRSQAVVFWHPHGTSTSHADQNRSPYWCFNNKLSSLLGRRNAVWTKPYCSIQLFNVNALMKGSQRNRRSASGMGSPSTTKMGAKTSQLPWWKNVQPVKADRYAVVEVDPETSKRKRTEERRTAAVNPLHVWIPASSDKMTEIKIRPCSQ